MKKKTLEDLFIVGMEAEVLKTLSDQENRLIKLEKIMKGNWGKGYDAGILAQLNTIITLGEDRESEMTLTDFIWYLKKRKSPQPSKAVK